MKIIKSALLLTLTSLLLSSCSNMDVEKLNERAIQLMNSGDVDGAISRLESINDLNPNFAQTHYNLGIAYYKKGQYDKAIAALSDAIKLNKNLGDAYYTLGVIYEDQAQAAEDKLKGKAPDSKTVQLILTNLNSALDSYNKYLTVSKDAQDASEVQSQIQLLHNDMAKYQRMISVNSESQVGQ